MIGAFGQLEDNFSLGIVIGGVAVVAVRKLNNMSTGFSQHEHGCWRGVKPTILLFFRAADTVGITELCQYLSMQNICF